MALEAGGPWANASSRRRLTPTPALPSNGDGEWQVTYETFRDMAAYAVGLVLIYLLVVAPFQAATCALVIMAPSLTIIGVMPGHASVSGSPATSMISADRLARHHRPRSSIRSSISSAGRAAGMAFREPSCARRRCALFRALTALAAMLRRPVHPRRPDLQRAGHEPDLPGILVSHPAHPGGHPGALLHRLSQEFSNDRRTHHRISGGGGFVLLGPRVRAARSSFPNGSWRLPPLSASICCKADLPAFAHPSGCS